MPSCCFRQFILLAANIALNCLLICLLSFCDFFEIDAHWFLALFWKTSRQILTKINHIISQSGCPSSVDVRERHNIGFLICSPKERADPDGVVPKDWSHFGRYPSVPSGAPRVHPQWVFPWKDWRATIRPRKTRPSHHSGSSGMCCQSWWQTSSDGRFACSWRDSFRYFRFALKSSCFECKTDKKHLVEEIYHSIGLDFDHQFIIRLQKILANPAGYDISSYDAAARILAVVLTSDPERALVFAHHQRDLLNLIVAQLGS